MIEIWEQATLPHNLPLTVLVGLFTSYWIICLLGIVGVDTFDVDLDTDIDLDTDASHHSPLTSVLRFVNAADVPLMAILSFLATFMWIICLLGNYYLNPNHLDWLILTIFAVSFITSVILVKIFTTPLVPIFKKMKELEKAEPAVGGVAVVVSKEVDGKYGQCEQQRTAGAPAILNCMTTQDEPIARGTEVAVVSYDKDKGIYTVRSL